MGLRCSGGCIAGNAQLLGWWMRQAVIVGQGVEGSVGLCWRNAEWHVEGWVGAGQVHWWCRRYEGQWGYTWSERAECERACRSAGPGVLLRSRRRSAVQRVAQRAVIQFC